MDIVGFFQPPLQWHDLSNTLFMLVPFAGNGKRAKFISEQWSASEKTPFNRIPSGEKKKKKKKLKSSLLFGLG